MWLTLIVMLVSYLLQPRNTAAERRRALLGSAAAGAITYGVTEYTDWGKENLAPLNDEIGEYVWPSGNDGSKATNSSGLKPWASGISGALKSIGPGTAAAFLGGAALGGVPSWVWLMGGAVALLVISK